jgi:hypothetical protein
VKKVAAITDFYTLSTDMGASRDVEHWLRDVETRTQRVLAQDDLLALSLAQERRQDLAFFVALQYLRTPVAREMFDRLARETITDFFHQNFATASPKHLAQLYEEVYGYAPVGDEVERFRQGGMALAQLASPPSYGNNHMRVMVEKAQVIAGILIERPWRVFVWREQSILTSDNPVVLYSAARKYRAGFANADHILFPLDSRTCLIIDAMDERPRGSLLYVPGNSAESLFVNRAQFLNSERWMFANPETRTPLIGITF